MAPRRSAELNLRLIREHVEEIVLVSDDEMFAAARWLWRELGVAAELAGAAAVAALLCGRVPLRGARQPCAVVCDAGRERYVGELIEKPRDQLRRLSPPLDRLDRRSLDRDSL